VSGFNSRIPPSSFETWWVNICIWLKSSASIAGFILKSEPQNIGYRNSKSLFRSDRPLQRPAAALAPETRNLTPTFYHLLTSYVLCPFRPPHSTFQLPHSKVPDTLTEENPRNIIIKNQYHQQYKKKQTDLLGDFSDLNADRTTFNGFDRKEEQVAAVQDRDGKQVDNG